MPARRLIPLSILTIAATFTMNAQPAARRDTVVKPAGAPIHAKTAKLVEELSIGVVDGAEEYMFGDVADITLGADGSLFVLDRKIPVVRQYDAKGKFIRNVGRSGSGPGEYRNVSGLATQKDGKLLLWDTGNWRVNVYSPTGETLTQWLTPSGGVNASATYSRAIMVDTDGNVWCRGTTFTRGADGVARRTVWYRVDEGGIRDTIQSPAMPAPLGGLTATVGNASVSSQLPFSPQPQVVRTPLGGFVTGFPSRFAFEFVAPGKPITSVRRENVRPQPVAESERSAEKERIEKMMRGTDAQWSWNGPEIPHTRPHYSGIAVGLDGRVWVAVVPEGSPRVGAINTPASFVVGGGGGGAPAPRPRPQITQAPRDDKPALYALFEPDGRYIGDVEVPPRVSTVIRRGDQVWGVGYDGDDVPFVKRWRISWP